MFDFRRITLFCLEKRLSKHRITIFSKNFGEGVAPFAPPLATPMFTVSGGFRVKAIKALATDNLY